MHPELVAKAQELVHAGTTDTVEGTALAETSLLYMHVHWQCSQSQWPSRVV